MIGSASRLYKDGTKSILFGVCAGLANYLNIKVGLVRLFFLMPFPPFWLVYLVLVLVLEDEPASFRSQTVSVNQMLAAIEQQLQQIEHDIVRLEAYVTSDAFELQSKVINLNEK